MESLVNKILEISNREPDLPVDVVDLGTYSSEAPTTMAADKKHAYSNGNSTTYDTSSGNTRLVGLAGHNPKSEPTEHNSTCCV